MGAAPATAAPYLTTSDQLGADKNCPRGSFCSRGTFRCTSCSLLRTCSVQDTSLGLLCFVLGLSCPTRHLLVEGGDEMG